MALLKTRFAFGVVLLLLVLPQAVPQQEANGVLDPPLSREPRSPSAVRLVNGAVAREGRVEILVQGSWLSLCADVWTFNEADVVCRQLGFGYAVSVVTDGGFGHSMYKQLQTRILCSPGMQSITDCIWDATWGAPCSGKLDAGVVCNNDSLTYGSLRLWNSLKSGYAGFLQIYINGSWGYVCDADWRIYEAGVTCRQMRFDDSNRFQSVAMQGNRLGWLHHVRCIGIEEKLIQCHYSELRLRACSLYDLVAIQCERIIPATDAPHRLSTEVIASTVCFSVAFLVVLFIVVFVVVLVVWYRRKVSVTVELTEATNARRRSNLWSIFYPLRRRSHPDPDVFSDEDAPPPTYNYPWYLNTVPTGPSAAAPTPLSNSNDGAHCEKETCGSNKFRSRHMDSEQPPPYRPLAESEDEEAV